MAMEKKSMGGGKGKEIANHGVGASLEIMAEGAKEGKEGASLLKGPE